MKHPCQIYFFAVYLNASLDNEVALDAIEPPNMDDFFVPFLFFFVPCCCLLFLLLHLISGHLIVVSRMYFGGSL